jgi:alanyl-tRNA synthetase
MSPLTVNQIRSKFLAYMKHHGHAIVPSASLVPENDPTTLFTGSGMQPMLPYLLGQPHPLGFRIADSQKSFRSQDIEEVGDNRHTTFFEMLGNWSFGDYFKTEQIPWMWIFLIDELGLNPNNFYVTCFAGNDSLGVKRDTFSADLWVKLFKERGIEAKVSENPEAGMKDGEKIFYYNEKKNWWSRSGVPSNMPEGEPGGPDSEMFYDFDPMNEKKIHENSVYRNTPCHVNCDCGRFLEIGNNVFMQYKKVYLPDGSAGFQELPRMNVDHGSGLERYAAALRNDLDMFNIDVFDKPKQILENLCGKKYEDDEKTIYAMRVVLDHVRSATFLIGDGVMPGNKDQMYFVRRLIRRAVRYARDLGVHENFTKVVAEAFIATYKEEYKNLEEKKESILSEIDNEETKFRKTLENGLKIIDKKIKTIAAYLAEDKTASDEAMQLTISGKDAFDLLQSYGFPIELTEEVARERGITVNKLDFEKEKEKHAEESRTASAGKFKGGLGGDGEMEVKYHTATHMLHQALREVLGETVEQRGSNITPERLRFDFAFERKMTDEEKKKVEDLINQRIKEALPVIREEVSMNEARARGAIGLFGDKYGDVVSIYRIGEGKKRGDTDLFSMEFCGGPHVSNTRDLSITKGPDETLLEDVFKIVKEEAVSSGVRRIKAVLQ